MTNSIEAIAFDKDGVIFDSESLYKRALSIAAKRCNLILPDDLADRMTGLVADKSFEMLAQAIGQQMDAADFIQHHWLATRNELLETEGLAFIEGSESLIETLYEQGYPLALVTSDSLDNLLEDVNRARPDLLKYFSVVITVDDVANPKPNSEPYDRAAAFLGVRAENLLVIEDSNYGVIAASDAGAKVLLLSHGRTVPVEIANRAYQIIEYISEATKALR